MDNYSGYALAVHGGAGNIRKDKMTRVGEENYRGTLYQALQEGERLLSRGHAAEEVTEHVIRVLEDSTFFNAGKGAVFTHKGTHEFDASIMKGKTLEAGSVAAVTSLKNPVSVASHIMRFSDHLMLSGHGGLEYAREHGLETADDAYFFNQYRYKQLLQVRDNNHQILDHEDDVLNDPFDEKYSTVGAVVLDKENNLAAGTSTGGMTNKKYGRIGDTPVIGSGTYANNRSCAVSCTGHGEFFMRINAAFQVHAGMVYGNKALHESARETIFNSLNAINGDGGLIALDRKGNIAFPFNTKGMFRGYVKAGIQPETQIF